MTPPNPLFSTEVPEEHRAWRRFGGSLLLILNVFVLLGFGAFAVDWLVRYRAEQLILQYHNGVIVPLTKPPAPPAAPKGG